MPDKMPEENDLNGLSEVPHSSDKKLEAHRGEPGTGAGELVSMDVQQDVAAGDFVGRDQLVFLGREQIPQQVVTIGGDVHGDIVIYPNTTLGRIGTQIERLRGRVTRLIPSEVALVELAKLREPKRIGREYGVEVTVFENIKYRFTTRPLQKRSDTDVHDVQYYLQKLNEIEGQVSPNIEPEKLSEILQELGRLSDTINIRIAQLNSLFNRIVYSATTSRELVQNMVTKTGHQEFRDEAVMHLEVIGQLVQKLNLEALTRPNFDVLSDEAYRAVGLMTELEKRRILVEGLVQADRSRRNWTILSVITYICAIIGLTIFAILRWHTSLNFGQATLNELRIPLLGIPWPVIVWSLIGSFAAMIHRFNANPIYDFTDAVKWMITRPVQGIVLGSTFYLILVSGLFLLTAGNVSDPLDLVSNEAIILALCFLVGFSDRFANSVFDALVKKFSNSKQEEQEDKS